MGAAPGARLEPILVLEIGGLDSGIGGALLLSAVLRARRTIADDGLEGLQLAAAVGRYDGLSEAYALVGHRRIERTRQAIEQLWRGHEPVLRALLEQEDQEQARAERLETNARFPR